MSRCLPPLRFSPLYGSWYPLRGTQTSTPPIVSTMARNELKLNSTKWSRVTPVRSSTVLTAQDGPPMFIAPSMMACW